MKENNRRTTIIKVAKECFLKYGFDKTTLDDIGKLAKLNKASLYYYFKSKDDIFIQVILEESSGYILGLQEKVAHHKTLKEKIIHYLNERMDYYDKVLHMNQLSLESLQRIEPKFNQVYTIVRDKERSYLKTLLDEAVAQKTIHTTIETEELAAMFLLLSAGFKHEAVRHALIAEKLFANEVDYSTVKDKQSLALDLIFKGLA